MRHIADAGHLLRCADKDAADHLAIGGDYFLLGPLHSFIGHFLGISNHSFLSEFVRIYPNLSEFVRFGPIKSGSGPPR